MANEIDEFNRLLSQRIKELIPSQMVWVVCKSVDWDKKTMIATGVVDDLDYHDILLGLESEFKKPAVGSKCLIALIENNNVNAILIFADEVESYLITDKTGFKIYLNNGQLELNGSSFSGIVKAPALVKELEKVNVILEKIQEVFSSWQPVPEDGGAALKALVTQFVTLQRGDYTDIENSKIKHG